MEVHVLNFAVIVLVSLSLGGPLPFDGKVRVNPNGDGSYIAYMKAPFASNHASFIEVLPQNTLAVAWFSGSDEGQSGVAIVFTTKPQNSDTFSAPVVISERIGYSNQNPVLFYDNTTSILHCYHSQQMANAGESNASIWHLQSSDYGLTWTTPSLLFTGGLFPRNRIIVTSDGKGLIFPIYSTKDSPNYSIMAISNTRTDVENLNAWQMYTVTESDNLVQPSVFRIENNDLKAFFRDRSKHSIHMSTSTHDGQHWNTPLPYGLPNNNAGIEANVIKIEKSMGLALVFNDYSGENQYGRTPLAIALSTDYGDTFGNVRMIQVHNDNQTHITGSVEFSYPSLLQTSDENAWIDIVYTYNRQTIKYLRCNVSWITQP